jgi:hypothetical protein
MLAGVRVCEADKEIEEGECFDVLDPVRKILAVVV